MENRFLLMLGLAKKAGLVSCGTELCREAVRAGKAKAVIACSDISENTRKRLEDCCGHYKIELLFPEGLTMDELSRAVGSRKLCSAVSINGEDIKHAVLSKIQI